MTAKKPPDAAPPRLPRFNPRDGYGLAYAVAGNPRLVALLPAEELAEMVERHDRAVRIAAEAAKVPIVQDDPAAKVREALASGEDVDVPALVTGMIEAKVAEVARRDVLAFFASLASGPKQDIAALITDSEDALYDGLSEQLDAVLDEGQAALRELGSVRTADDAIDAGLGEHWQHLRAAAREYAEVREAHLALLRVADSANFSPRVLGVGFAFFANLDAAEPAYTHIQQHGDTVRGFPGLRLAEGLGFPVNDPRDLRHFIAACQRRDELEPVISTASAAQRRMGSAMERYQSGETPSVSGQGELARHYGGERAAIERVALRYGGGLGKIIDRSSSEDGDF